VRRRRVAPRSNIRADDEAGLSRLAVDDAHDADVDDRPAVIGIRECCHQWRTADRRPAYFSLTVVSPEFEAAFLGGDEVNNEQRGLSPADQQKLGAAMAEVFAKAREAEKFDQLTRSLGHRCARSAVSVPRSR
jgi:hypothetical protein